MVVYLQLENRYHNSQADVLTGVTISAVWQTEQWMDTRVYHRDILFKMKPAYSRSIANMFLNSKTNYWAKLISVGGSTFHFTFSCIHSVQSPGNYTKFIKKIINNKKSYL